MTFKHLWKERCMYFRPVRGQILLLLLGMGVLAIQGDSSGNEAVSKISSTQWPLEDYVPTPAPSPAPPETASKNVVFGMSMDLVIGFSFIFFVLLIAGMMAYPVLTERWTEEHDQNPLDEIRAALVELRSSMRSSGEDSDRSQLEGETSAPSSPSGSAAPSPPSPSPPSDTLRADSVGIPVGEESPPRDHQADPSPPHGELPGRATPPGLAPYPPSS